MVRGRVADAAGGRGNRATQRHGGRVAGAKAPVLTHLLALAVWLGSIAGPTYAGSSPYALERDDSGTSPYATARLAVARAEAQVNWDGDVDDRGATSPDHDPVRLVEAFLRRAAADQGGGWMVLVGLTNPPFSLEHTGPARTPVLSLTPSALTSWLWEEGRVLGVEADWWRKGSEGGGRAVRGRQRLRSLADR